MKGNPYFKWDPDPIISGQCSIRCFKIGRLWSQAVALSRFGTRKCVRGGGSIRKIIMIMPKSSVLIHQNRAKPFYSSTMNQIQSSNGTLEHIRIPTVPVSQKNIAMCLK